MVYLKQNPPCWSLSWLRLRISAKQMVCRYDLLKRVLLLRACSWLLWFGVGGQRENKCSFSMIYCLWGQGFDSSEFLLRKGSLDFQLLDILLLQLDFLSELMFFCQRLSVEWLLMGCCGNRQQQGGAAVQRAGATRKQFCFQGLNFYVNLQLKGFI